LFWGQFMVGQIPGHWDIFQLTIGLSMLQSGISSIEFLPPWQPPSVLTRIAATVASCQSLRASVAYWTISGQEVSSHLPAKLAAPSGYLCADLHSPTDIDRLADLVRAGADVHLYCEKIKGIPDARHLLHAKLLLFDGPDEKAELWVGSHNWTRAALGGLNVEASLLVQVRKACSLYVEAFALLEKIRSVCEQFDLRRIDYYKWLQGESSSAEEDETIWSLELYGKNAGSLEHTTVALFGEDERDLIRVRPLAPIMVTVFDVDGGAAFNYSGRIFHNGPLERFNPAAGGLTLTRRRHAVRRGRQIPLLSDVKDIDPQVMKTSRYFISVHLETLDKDVVAYDLPRASEAWSKAALEMSPLVRRLSATERKYVFQNRAVGLFRPGHPEEVVPQLALVGTRLGSDERPLLLKKIFRRIKRSS